MPQTSQPRLSLIRCRGCHRSISGRSPKVPLRGGHRSPRQTRDWTSLGMPQELVSSWWSGMWGKNRDFVLCMLCSICSVSSIYVFSKGMWLCHAESQSWARNMTHEQKNAETTCQEKGTKHIPWVKTPVPKSLQKRLHWGGNHPKQGILGFDPQPSIFTKRKHTAVKGRRVLEIA